MAITEANRHRMYQRLEEVLGREQAATLMEHLPPVGWADVATKRDLDRLGDRLDSRIDRLADRLDGRIDRLGDQLRAEWRGELSRQTLALVLANAAMVAAVVAAVKL